MLMMEVGAGCREPQGLGASHRLMVQGTFSQEMTTELELQLDTYPKPGPFT